jgi:hypothetical protein
MSELNIPIPSLNQLDHIPAEQLQDITSYGHFVLAHGSESTSFRAQPVPTITEVNSPSVIVPLAAERLGEIVKLQNFDLEHALRPGVLGGPIIEVGGPTAITPYFGNYNMIAALGTMPDDIRISNISRHTDVGEYYIQSASRDLDYMADVRYLPHGNESIGAVLMSSLASDAYDGAFSEIARVITPNGLLIAEKIGAEALGNIFASGFTPEALQINGVVGTPGTNRSELVRMSGIFRRKAGTAGA